MLVFEVDDPAEVEEFVAADPYVEAGLVTEWRIEPGPLSGTPAYGGPGGGKPRARWVSLFEEAPAASGRWAGCSSVSTPRTWTCPGGRKDPAGGHRRATIAMR